MAPISQTQTRVLYDYLGSLQKVHILTSWLSACVDAEKLKIDYSSFKQMRREKVVPKRLGKQISKGSEMEPFSANEDQAISVLIKETASRKEAAFKKAADQWSNIRNDLTPHLVSRPNLFKEMEQVRDKKVAAVKREHQGKADHNLKTLISSSKWEAMARPGAVIDMSGNRINKTEKKLLSFGLKFSTGLNDSTPLHVARALNSFKSRYANDPSVPNISFIRASVIPYLDTARHATLPERYVKAFRSLVTKRDIYVLPSDKGGPVAVMRATRYHALGLDVLQDADTFTQVDEDDEEAIDVKVMQASHNRQIRAILDRLGGDQDELYRRLESPFNPQHPTMTAYPKVHKVPVKARPVISHRNTPMSRSCKWAADILSPYVGRISTAHIRDTRDFHTRVSRSKARGRLVSLDVRSLYTNIPVAEAIDVIREHSTGTNPTFKNIPIDPEIFCELLKICVSFNQFSFMGQFYRQHSGLPMGSSLSPCIANLYMEHFESQLIDDMIPAGIRPILWLRFVNDVFLYISRYSCT